MSADIIPFVSHCNTGAGLSDMECDIIARTAPQLPGAWHVQYDEDDVGHGSIALVPGRDEHSHETPVFLIWREGGHLHLGIGQGDFYAGLGIHADVKALLHAVRHNLEGAAAVNEWVSCELGSPAWKSGSAPSMHTQSQRPN